MADPKRQSMPPRTIAPLRLDSTMVMRERLEISPSRSSTQSSGPSRAHTPSSSVPNTPLLSARPSSPQKRPPPTGESNSFLTALAAQERRVLELKEELQKAEVELEKLKKQWALHETIKKRNELRHLEQLQSFTSSWASDPASHDEVSDRVDREPDRRIRKPSGAKSSQRTVFSGSRHTRTLSLLSPKESVAELHPPSQGDRPPNLPLKTVKDAAVTPTVHRLGTSSDGSNVVNELYKGPSREVILETGKQLVGDFRQGLWTFLDDLRQVTVGDEAASSSDHLVQPNLHSGNLAKRQAPRERGSNTKESPMRKADKLRELHALRIEQGTGNLVSKVDNQAAGRTMTPVAPPTSRIESDHSRHTNNSSSDSDDDGWDNWETSTTKGSTPRRRKDTLHIVDPMASPLTDKSSPRTSMSSSDTTLRFNNPPNTVDKPNDIPWPALKKLTPSRLSRTASTLMAEWERSLAPHAIDGADSAKIASKEQKAD